MVTMLYEDAKERISNPTIDDIGIHFNSNGDSEQPRLATQISFGAQQGFNSDTD
jgi:hypothetical protein